LDKDTSVSYLDFIKDPLNTKLVIAELTESVEDGIVVLKTTKEILANSELFISFGKAYHIDKSEITKAALDNQTSKIIQNYIESHM